MFSVLCCITMHVSDPDVSSLKTLGLEGHFSFHDIYDAAKDFGNRFKFLPSAVLHPESVTDIPATVKHVFRLGLSSKLTVAARGHVHSLQGQAQVPGGIVIQMASLRRLPETRVHVGDFPYVDADQEVSYGSMFCSRVLCMALHQSPGLTTSTLPSGGRYRIPGSAGRPSSMDRRSATSTSCKL